MTVYFYPLSEYAVGYDNIGGLAPWESLVDQNGVRLFAPVIFGTYTPGEFEPQTDGLNFIGGWAMTGIKWTAITQAGVYTLINTVTNGTYSRKLTIRFRKEDPNTYYYANAILTLKPLAASKKQSQAYTDYEGTLTRLRIITP